MIDDILGVIGRGYAPIVTQLPDGTYDVSTDWAYLGCIALILVTIYCAFKIFGRLVCGRDR